jgi:hypothetical protein
VYYATGYILPKYYYVEKHNVELEKANPGSQEKISSDEDSENSNIFLWGQSVYIVSQLLGKILLYLLFER